MGLSVEKSGFFNLFFFLLDSKKHWHAWNSFMAAQFLCCFETLGFTCCISSSIFSLTYRVKNGTGQAEVFWILYSMTFLKKDLCMVPVLLKTSDSNKMYILSLRT